MDVPDLAQYVLFLLVVVLCVKPVGLYLLRVFDGQRTFLDPALRPVERFIYRLAGVDPQSEMDWRQYASAFTTFGLLGTTLLFAILMAQQSLPWFDPEHQSTPMTLDLASRRMRRTRTPVVTLRDTLSPSISAADWAAAGMTISTRSRMRLCSVGCCLQVLHERAGHMKSIRIGCRFR
jgi:hypothetical protein